MKQIFTGAKFDFMRHRKLGLIFSGVLILISCLSFAVRGLNLGVDFTGGTVIEVGYAQAVELSDVRRALANTGFGSAVVQHFGTARDVLVRLPSMEGKTSAQTSSEVLTALNAGGQGEVQMRRVEFVGPQVGSELAEQGGLALLGCLAAILIYVSLRFEKRLALGAVLALVHDVTITLGVFSLLQVEFDLTVLAALLAVIGYSLNDTIVVFDRLRENFRKMRKASPAEMINAAINQTLGRTINTSGTTLFVVVALFVLGGEALHGFSIALLVGIGFGTYSSVYVASVFALMLGLSKVDLMPVEKEGAALDNRP
jgi:preprotein translocase subunit SecF